VKSVGGRVSNEPLALNAVIIPQDTGSVALDAGYAAYCPEALTRVCIATNTAGQVLYNSANWVGMMGLSGLPSLLAVAGLLGFAVVEAMLPY
jgi:hypothetical protein